MKFEDNALAMLALKRRDKFPNRESIINNFKTKIAYKDWTRACLEAYVDHGFKEQTIDGTSSLVLKCSPKEESNYYHVGVEYPAGEHIHEIQIPVLVVLGYGSTFFEAFGEMDAISRLGPNGTVKHVEGSHFVPMEKPKELAQEILDFINKHLKSKM